MSDIEYDESEVLEEAMKARDFLQAVPRSCPEGFTITQEANAQNLLFSLKQQITDIFLANMKDKYIDAGWTCDTTEKQKELFHRASRFILITKSLPTSTDVTNIHKEELVAYMMFRFTWDDEDEPEYPVLYLYELQVSAAFQRQGWGKLLLDYAVALARHFQMRKVRSKCSTLV